jgi:hypothetical protein
MAAKIAAPWRNSRAEFQLEFNLGPPTLPCRPRQHILGRTEHLKNIVAQTPYRSSRATRRAPDRPWAVTGATGAVFDPAALTAAVTRGVCRWLEDSGFITLREFKLGNGRRADVVGLNTDGTLVMVEVKSTAGDYRNDTKWLEYVPYCDAFTFAVPPEFPWQILPSDCGVVIADAHSAAVIRHAVPRKLHAARRRALTLRFALAAGQRLSTMLDPRM